MRYLSVCSGIEAASVAWHPLGWQACAFSEIEKFPSAVLAHHYPDTPNHGDMTRFQEWPAYEPDVLVGGTPCQSFSVAGLRKGMADPRGNLALVYLALADRYRPRWVVWENVPGVLSSAGGRDFGAFLGGLAELGYGWAYRALDAQFFGLAQRRRRVFVVGCLGDWRGAAAVLFERASLSGNPAPRREARERPAPTIAARTRGGGGLGTDFDCDGGLIARTLLGKANSSHAFDQETYVPQWPAEVACTLNAAYGDKQGLEDQHALGGGQLFVRGVLPQRRRNGPTGCGKRNADPDRGCFDVTHTLKADGFDASEDGTGWGTPLVPSSMGHDGSHANGGGQVAVAFAHVGMAVRRLTPRECSRLQGFPDDYLELTYADADEAHAAQVLHELWREAGTPAVEEQGWRTGIVAALLTPEILLAGVHVGWLSWEMAARCASARGALSGEKHNHEGFVRSLRQAGQAGRSPFGRESFEQCARQLGSDLSLLPLEGAQARKVLRRSELWPQAQARWSMRYAFAKGKTGKAALATPDGPRYKALGNSFAVPVVRWIGERIQSVEGLCSTAKDVA
jgi:DNA (cytosine-5)-methyltransferase 1